MPVVLRHARVQEMARCEMGEGEPWLLVDKKQAWGREVDTDELHFQISRATVSGRRNHIVLLQRTRTCDRKISRRDVPTPVASASRGGTTIPGTTLHEQVFQTCGPRLAPGLIERSFPKLYHGPEI